MLNQNINSLHGHIYRIRKFHWTWYVQKNKVFNIIKSSQCNNCSENEYLNIHISKMYTASYWVSSSLLLIFCQKDWRHFLKIWNMPLMLKKVYTLLRNHLLWGGQSHHCFDSIIQKFFAKSCFHNVCTLADILIAICYINV